MELRKEVWSGAGPFEWRLRFTARPDIAELLAARDAFFSDQPFEHQFARRNHRGGILLAGETDLIHQVEQAGNDAEPLEERLGALVGRNLQRAALVEPVNDVVHVGATDAAFEGPTRRAANQVFGDRLRSLKLAFVLELELAGDGGKRGIHVGDARHDGLLFRHNRAALGIRQHVIEHADRQPLRHAAAAIYALVVARFERDSLDQLRHEVGNANRPTAAVALAPRLRF